MKLCYKGIVTEIIWEPEHNWYHGNVMCEDFCGYTEGDAFEAMKTIIDDLRYPPVEKMYE